VRYSTIERPEGWERRPTRLDLNLRSFGADDFQVLSRSAIRIIGDGTRDRLEVLRLREADWIVAPRVKVGGMLEPRHSGSVQLCGAA